MRGFVFYWKGDYAQARQFLDRATALNPGNTYALMLRGRIKWSAGERADALADLEKAAALGDPESIELLEFYMRQSQPRTVAAPSAAPAATVAVQQLVADAAECVAIFDTGERCAKNSAKSAGAAELLKAIQEGKKVAIERMAIWGVSARMTQQDLTANAITAVTKIRKLIGNSCANMGAISSFQEQCRSLLNRPADEVRAEYVRRAR